MFVDGGGRIVDETTLSAHDEKLLGARQRRQKQLAEKRGRSEVGAGDSALPLSRNSLESDFNQSMNFGHGGVVGFLVQAGASGHGAARVDQFGLERTSE